MLFVLSVAAALQHHHSAPFLQGRTSEGVQLQAGLLRSAQRELAQLDWADWKVWLVVVVLVVFALGGVGLIWSYFFKSPTSPRGEGAGRRGTHGVPKSPGLKTPEKSDVRPLSDRFAGGGIGDVAGGVMGGAMAVTSGSARLVIDGLEKVVETGHEAAEKALDLTPRAVVEFISEDSCIITYDPVDLTSWRALYMLKGTVFTQSSLWYVICMTLALSCSIAIFLSYYVEHPEHYSTKVISSVIEVVTVAMAFLLGLFVNNALARWWDIVKTFEEMFGACKGLLSVLVNFDTPQAIRRTVARRCVLSVTMLRYENVVSKVVDASGHSATEDAWKRKMDQLEADGEILEEERRVLESVPEQARSMFCWNLIAKAVKELHTDPSHKELGKAMDYRTVYSMVQQGAGAVSRLKSTSNFHFPFLYVHMLAWMVHLVNFLTAIGAGITIGLTIARVRASCAPDSGGHTPVTCQVLDGGIIFKELLFLYIQVFLYQAFLSIGAALSFPIVPKGHGAMYRLPLAEMIEALRGHLTLLNKLADKGDV